MNTALVQQSNIVEPIADKGEIREKVKEVSYQVLSSGLKLGVLLIEVADNKLYEQWGYDSFKSYCESEVTHIGYGTSHQICSAVRPFIERIKSKSGTAGFLPSYTLLDLLQRSKKKLPENEYNTLTEQVFEGKLGRTSLKEKIQHKIITIEKNLNRSSTIIKPEETEVKSKDASTIDKAPITPAVSNNEDSLDKPTNDIFLDSKNPLKSINENLVYWIKTVEENLMENFSTTLLTEMGVGYTLRLLMSFSGALRELETTLREYEKEQDSDTGD